MGVVAEMGGYVMTEREFQALEQAACEAEFAAAVAAAAPAVPAEYGVDVERELAALAALSALGAKADNQPG